MAATIRRYEESDRNRVLPIVENNFGGAAKDRLAARWDWQFNDNPAAREAPALRWVAEAEGDIIAYIGSYPGRLKVLDREMSYHLGCDLVSYPDDRRRDFTMVMRLIKASMDAEGNPLQTCIDYTPEHERLRMYLKHARMDMIPTLFRPVRAGGALTLAAERGRIPGWLGRGAVKAVAAAAGDLALGAVNALKRPARDRRFEVRRIEALDAASGAAFDDLWRRISPKFPIVAVRDQAFVRWRFFEDPVFENAVFGAFDESGALVGYVAARTGKADDGLLKGRVLDLFCDPDEPGAVRDLAGAAVRYLEREKVDLIYCRGLLPALREAVRGWFYVAPKNSRDPALIRWMGDPELTEAVHDAANWHFTYADSEQGFTHP